MVLIWLGIFFSAGQMQTWKMGQNMIEMMWATLLCVVLLPLLEAKSRGKNRLANVNFSLESEINEMSV